MAKSPSNSQLPRSETVTKLDAARRQLTTAISLWFYDGDTVSIHALAHAAYEVIHNLSKPYRSDTLLFDSDIVKSDYRKFVNDKIREAPNFFKHAKREKSENETLEFNPDTSELFFVFSIRGLSQMGVGNSDEEFAYFMWTLLHRPRWFSGDGAKLLAHKIGVEELNRIKDSLTKREFFEGLVGSRSLGVD